MTKPITSFIVLLLSIGFAFFYVKPEYELVQQRRSDIVSLSEILNNSSKIKTLIDQTTQNLNTVDDGELSRFAVFLPETIDVIRFANTIQHIGLSNGVILEDIKIDTTSGNTNSVQGKTTSNTIVSSFSLGSKIDQAQGVSASPQTNTFSSGNKYATTKATFSLNTTYGAFQQFLGSLEKSLGLINVTSLTFSPVVQGGATKKTGSTGSQIYQYNVAIETYSLK